jgi:general secretion pathway protein L
VESEKVTSSQKVDAQEGDPPAVAGAVPERPEIAPFPSLAGLAETAGASVIAAEHLSLFALTLPVRSRRRQGAALPFALEDRIGQPIERCHFAVCGAAPEGGVLAAVVDTDRMERAVAAAPDGPVVAEQMLLAVPPVGEDRLWRVLREGGRVVARLQDGTGFAASVEGFMALWAAFGRPAVLSHGEALPKEVEVQDLSGAGLPSPGELSALDLRQGRFRPPLGIARPLRLVAAASALAVLLHLGIAAADARALREVADDLRLRADRLLEARVPGASAEDDPALILRRIRAGSSPQTGSAFLPLLDRVSAALAEAETSVSFSGLSWGDGRLRLTVEAADLDALQRVEARLKARGLDVSSGSATADAGAARAEFTVRP